MATSDSTLHPKKRRTRLIDLVGQRFGMLVITYRAPNHSGRVRWAYLCDCGGSGIATTSNLRGGASTSCGCRTIKALLSRNTTHGKSKSTEFKVWVNMLARCNNRNTPCFHYYGGRGIYVCERWNDFSLFYADMGPRPSTKHSLDRIDNDGPYSPDNCRWATSKEQASNTRRNVFVELDNEVITAAEAARRTGLHIVTLLDRVHRGEVGERLFRPASTSPPSL